MLVFTIYSSMGRSLNSKFVALALIIFSTSAFPFRDDSASKNLTLSKISSRDQTPSNDPTDDQFLGSADPVGSSLGLTADNSNQQQLIPLDGLDSAENLETLGSSSDQADSSSPTAGTSDMASRPRCGGGARQVEKRSDDKDGLIVAGGMHRQFQFPPLIKRSNSGLI